MEKSDEVMNEIVLRFPIESLEERLRLLGFNPKDPRGIVPVAIGPAKFNAAIVEWCSRTPVRPDWVEVEIRIALFEDKS